MLGMFKKKTESTVPVEPKISSSRFDDMENELLETNPERHKEAHGARYLPSPVIDDIKKSEPAPFLNSAASANVLNVRNQDFTRQMNALQNREDPKTISQRAAGLPVTPSPAISRDNVNIHTHITQEELLHRKDEEKKLDERNYQNSMIPRNNEIPEAPLPHNAQRTAHGFLVSCALSEQQFQEYLKGNKNVLKVFPVLAENPEQAASLIESKNLIPVEVFDYNFFKAQVDRVEQLARENGIILLKK